MQYSIPQGVLYATPGEGRTPTLGYAKSIPWLSLLSPSLKKRIISLNDNS